MGSAAFLNEAISQLADKYLQLAQSAAQSEAQSEAQSSPQAWQSNAQRIPQADYAAEKQKVKAWHLILLQR